MKMCNTTDITGKKYIVFPPLNKGNMLHIICADHCKEDSKYFFKGTVVKYFWSLTAPTGVNEQMS